jgi:prevent-host-death family protein
MTAANRKTPAETLKFTQARQNLSQVVNRVARREARIIVEKSGVPVAAIVSTDDLQRLDEMDARSQAQMEAMSRISEAFADVPLDQLERQVALALAEVRDEMRAEDETASQR